MSDQPQFLISLSSIGPETLSRMPVCMIGTFWKGKTKFSITRKDVATMAANFARDGRGEVSVDYEHASEMPGVAAGQPIPAAGWIKSIEAEPDADGVVWASVEFTDRAREMIAAKEYKYVSPVLKWGVRDPNTGVQQGITLTSAALTNTPVLDRMPAIQLSSVGDGAGWVKGEDAMAGNEKVMCAVHPNTALICPECDTAAVDQLVASRAVRVLQVADIGRDPKTGRLQLSKLAADAVLSLSAATAIREEAEALGVVAAAVATGKIAPAKRETFEALILSNRASYDAITKDMQDVPLSEVGVAGTGAEQGAGEVEQIDLRLSKLADAELAANPGLTYGGALKLVASKNRELVGRRTRLLRGIKSGESEGEE